MQSGQIAIIGVVVLLIALGVAARLTVRTSNSSTRRRFLTWAPLAVLALVYVVWDAVNMQHHWFGTFAMLLLLCTSTYDLIATRRNNP
jgi:hypothetical protein